VVADRSEIVRESDGVAVRVSVAAALVARTDGGAADLLCVLTDVTEHELMEHALQTRQRMEAIGRLAGGVAHDFNNLLTVIIGYSDLLADRLGSDHQFYDDVDAIREAGRRAAAFTEQLLTISGRRVAETATVDLAATVRAIEPVLQRLVGGDVTLRVDLTPDTGWIKIDQSQFEQVILNLVVNARDAMPDGGILRMATGSTTDSDGRTWSQLIVEDGGVGMDEATLERCFEPFFTTKDRGKGTGLGLATVYRVVDEAGGVVSVESTPGVGTTVKVTLPTVAEEVTAVVPATAADGVDLAASILLVEDDAEVRGFARTVLVDAGYTVHEASCGADALDINRRLPTPVSLLVTDVVMPGMSGLELTMKMAGVPVLFISGFVEDERRQDLLQETPSSRFLAKPFLARELLAEVRALLATAAQGSKR
jgi:two-component system cell cycle sensor histidine kinase/response regulator CckA